MFYTITLNTSLDYIYLTNTLILGKANRLENPHRNIGGKGINVARVLKTLNSKVLLGGFLGSYNEKQVLDGLSQENLTHTDFMLKKEYTRNAITIMHDNNTHTEILEKGLKLNEKDIGDLIKRINNNLETYPDIKYLNISGSANSYDTTYLELLNGISNKVSILFDISSNQLIALLKSQKPIFFIKPNEHEMSDILRLNDSSKETLIKHLDNPLFSNIEHLLISCGKNGALYKYKNSIYDITVPDINVKNTTGSGDSTVAGFTYALEHKYDLEQRLKFAMACGMSNAINIGTGDIKQKQIEYLLDDIRVKKIKDW